MAENTKCCQGCGKAEILTYCCWECKWYTTLKNEFLKKLTTHSTCDPATLLLHIYPKEMKLFLCVHMKTCIQMFIAALVIIANNWKQPQTIPSTGEWINKLWHIHTMEYGLTSKRNKLHIREINIQQCEWILKSLCYIEDRHKRICTICFHLHGTLERTNLNYKDKSRSTVAWGWGCGKWGKEWLGWSAHSARWLRW